MGRTYKDESVGADGKFRNRQRNHQRRTVARNTKAPEVSSDAFDYDDVDTNHKNSESDTNDKS